MFFKIIFSDSCMIYNVLSDVDTTTINVDSDVFFKNLKVITFNTFNKYSFLTYFFFELCSTGIRK